MREGIVKKYSNAFIEALSARDLDMLLQKKDLIEALFKNEEFLAFLKSPNFDSLQKLSFVEEVLDLKQETLKQALNVLSQNQRLILLGWIVKEIEKYLANKHLTYEAMLYSKNTLNSDEVENFKQCVAKKLGVSLKVSQKQDQTEGIRFVVEDLGVELSFSKEKMMEKLKEEIFRSI